MKDYDQYRLRREELAREFWQCVAFSFVAIVTLYTVLSLN